MTLQQTPHGMASGYAIESMSERAMALRVSDGVAQLSSSLYFL